MAAAVSKNNAYSVLAGSLTNVATSLTVTTGHGDRFPVVSGSDWAILTLNDSAGNIEIIKCTARGSGADTMTIARAQEGTTARAWSIGDIVELRPTAGTVASVDGTQTLTNKSMSGADNTFTSIPTAALVVVAAIKTFLDAANLVAARAALGLTSIGEALATAASAAAGRSAISAAKDGANTDITSVGAITGVTAATANRSTLLATTEFAGQSAPAGAIQAFAMNTVPAGWLECDGSAVSRASYPNLLAALIKSSTATITIATPGVVSWTAHGRRAHDPIRFTTTGALPTGLAVATTYYVRSTGLTADAFQLSATPGGAAINTSGTQSGVHTAIHAPHGIGDGSTTFNVPDYRGEFLRGWDAGKGTDASRAFGLSQTDAIQGHKHSLGLTLGGSGAGGNGGSWVSTATDTGTPISDGTNGTPRTAAETRPRNMAVMYCIKT